MDSTSKEALQFLMDGNRRFAGFHQAHPHQDEKRLKDCASGQKPLAAVICCSDSRVPPEIIFDCGIGDIFIIRTAGTVLDNAAIASVEYAVDHLKVPLIMVLGHTSCGAVTAAMQNVEAPGALGNLLNNIRSQCSCAEDKKINRVIEEYTRKVATDLKNCLPVIQPAVHKKMTSVIAACYSIGSGVVELLEDL